MRGTERLAWTQPDYASWLHFRLYVDEKPVDLPDATCNTSPADAECTSPLPALTDGIHTIALVNVIVPLGVESQRTAPLTVQKVSSRASASTLPLAFVRSGGLRLEPVITIADRLSFTADIVATGVRAPAQMAWLPDGRLLVADADGRVRVVRPGETEHAEPAFDTSMLTTPPIAPIGIASHPDFARNRLVYLSLLERERSGDTRLRVLRLREVGDTLGESATLFDAPVAGHGSPSGPRMAFGPDRLLYVMLPPGLEFVNEPAASTPLPSMLRLSDDGRAPSIDPLSGVTATPLAFTWHPVSGALWVVFRAENGETSLRSFDARARTQQLSDPFTRVRVRERGDALLVQPAANDSLVPAGVARLALPAQVNDEVSDRIGDVVAGDGGTLFVSTSNGLLAGGGAGAATDMVVRLRPVPVPIAR